MQGRALRGQFAIRTLRDAASDHAKWLAESARGLFMRPFLAVCVLVLGLVLATTLGCGGGTTPAASSKTGVWGESAWDQGEFGP